MADMRFDTNPNEFGAPPQYSQGNDVTARLVQWGLAANRQQAEYILIGIAVVCLLVAGYFIFFSGGNAAPPPPPVS